MGKPTGFIEIQRKKAPTRPVAERLKDWNEVYQPYPGKRAAKAGARCMDCGIPFCHQGCPLGNLIPDWNDLVYRNRWEPAIERLHATNNFPEFTGRLCPAPCEGSCARHQRRPCDDQVDRSIHHRESIRRRMGDGQAATRAHRQAVAVIGSGPAGLAAADQLNRAGHFVTVFEKSDRIGGLLRYGIPEFKMEKKFLNRRLSLMEQEGVYFRANVNVGVDMTFDRMKAEYDAIVLAGGAGLPRDLPVPGRDLKAFTSRWSTSVIEQTCRGRSNCRRRLHQRERQKRRDYRRRRYRRRLSRHRASPGRAVRASVRAASEAPGHARGRQPMAAMAQRLSRVDGA